MNNPSFIVVPDAFAYGGQAVATLPDGRRCFLPFASPGDKAEIALVSERKRFAVGRIAALLQASPSRIEPECPLFRQGICPGCAYQHVSRQMEAEWKQKQLERFMVHSGLAEKTEPFVPAPERYFWRNKITLSLVREGEKILAGYTGFDNRTVFPVEECLLAEKPLAGFIRATLADPEFRETIPEGKSKAVFRSTEKDGPLVVSRENKSRLLTENIPGHGSFQVPAGSFFQINRKAAGLLLDSFQSLIQGLAPDFFAELYCGAGIFSAAAARAGVPEVLGVESDSSAVHAAKLNLKGVQARFLAGDSSVLFRRNLFPRGKNGVLLVDPPRTGIGPETMEGLLRSPVSRLIYISCGPDTLERDLKRLVSAGWKVRKTGGFDLFPATMHFESMTFLEKE